MAGRILVLDDEENYAQMLQELLREHNYRVDMATRPERAIDQLEEIPYDLVISDYKMPVMDGADFLKKAREMYPNLPFILVSGLMNTPELVKVANMSVTLVMEKPLNTAIFLQEVARFSKPMTDEEKAEVSNEVVEEELGAAEQVNYPDEPRYVSAKSDLSKSFLREAWATCESKSHLYLLDTSAGEAELAVKDLSIWMGNRDYPVEVFEFSELMAGGVEKLKTVAQDAEKSNVVCVRIPGSADLISTVEFIQTELSGLDTIFPIFVVGAEAAAEFEVATNEQGLVVPPIAQRPSDVAEYITRFMHLGRERQGKAQPRVLTNEAIYALLAYGWRSYEEIQDVLMRVASEVDSPEVSLESLTVYLPGAVAQVPAAEQRLAVLLQQAQTRFLDDLIGPLERAPSELRKRLELDSSVEIEGPDLDDIPLIKPELAQL